MSPPPPPHITPHTVTHHTITSSLPRQHSSHGERKRMIYMQWKLQTMDTVGKYLWSIVGRLSLSQRVLNVCYNRLGGKQFVLYGGCPLLRVSVIVCPTLHSTLLHISPNTSLRSTKRGVLPSSSIAPSPGHYVIIDDILHPRPSAHSSVFASQSQREGICKPVKVCGLYNMQCTCFNEI